MTQIEQICTDKKERKNIYSADYQQYNNCVNLYNPRHLRAKGLLRQPPGGEVFWIASLRSQ